MPWTLLGLSLAAYLCGSLTFGLWLAWAVGGIDIREHGSRNVGATNVGRVLGAKWGVVCLVLDALKGLLPTLLLPRLGGFSADMAGHATVACAAATVLGHVFPVWLGFRGGKGVATAAGAAGAVSPWGLFVAVTAFGAVFGARRIVSLASLAAAVVYGAVAIAVPLGGHPLGPDRWSVTLFAAVVPTLVIARHAKNIGRLVRGEEGRLVTQTDAAGDGEASGDGNA